MKKQGNSIIEVNELTKRFGNVTAVNHISFSVGRGEVFGFLGPNGAGKTTTIRMLTGLLNPDSGKVFIDGFDIRKNQIGAKMKMGVIPETGNVYVDLTAKQNITLAGKFYGIDTKQLEKSADRLLDEFGLYERKDDIVRNFSKGMKQRVNIASALVHNPEILFLDEPGLGLDVQSRHLIRKITREMNQKGTTVFLTTHNIEEANIQCRRVGIIDKGRIAAIDTPENLKRIFEEAQSVEISFNKPVDKALIENSRLAERIVQFGDKWKLYTDNPDGLVKYLAKLAQDRGLILTSMQICRPSLENVFVKLTEGNDYAG